MKPITDCEENLQQIANRLELSSLRTIELLQSYAAIINELRTRDVMRTKNNPVAGYSEWLVANALGLDLERNSRADFVLEIPGTKRVDRLEDV